MHDNIKIIQIEEFKQIVHHNLNCALSQEFEDLFLSLLM